MKKIVTVVLAGVLTVSLLGCSAKAPAAESPNAASPSPEQSQTAPEQSAEAPSEAPSLPSDGQAPDTNAQAPDADVQSFTSVFGKVKSIVGNEIELELAKPPFDLGAPEGEEGGEAVAAAAAAPAKSVTVTSEESDINTESADSESPKMMFESADGSVVVVSESDDGTSKLELEYTGESKSITIPAGISIMNMLTGKSARLEDIKKGSVLMLGVDDAAAERASAQSVAIME